VTEEEKEIGRIGRMIKRKKLRRRSKQMALRMWMRLKISMCTPLMGKVKKN